MTLREEIQDRVRALAKDEELDDYLPEPEEALPWGLIGSIWAGLAFISALVAFVRAEWVVLAVLVLTGLLLIAVSPVMRTDHQRRRHRLGRKGRIVSGAVAQVNNGWLEDDNEEAWPAMIVASFDPAAEDDGGALLQEIVVEMWELKRSDRRTLEGEELQLAWVMYSEIGRKHRLPIPPALTHGLKDCWLLSTMLPVAPLRHGEILIYLLMLEDDETEAGSVALPVEPAIPA